MAGQTTFEFLFRVLRPVPEVWTAMPSVLLAQYPDQHIGELPTMYRHSTHVSGLRSYIVITQLTTETETSTRLSIGFNPRVMTIIGAKRGYCEQQATSIFNKLTHLLGTGSLTPP